MTAFPDVFHGTAADGRIKLESRDAFAALLQRLDGKEITIKLMRRRRQRSLGQNAYLHAVVIPMLAEAAGYDCAEMKDALKQAFLTVPATERGKLPIVRSTADLSTSEMKEFVESCQRLGATMYGINIPDPVQAREMLG